MAFLSQEGWSLASRFFVNGSHDSMKYTRNIGRCLRLLSSILNTFFLEVVWDCLWLRFLLVISYGIVKARVIVLNRNMNLTLMTILTTSVKREKITNPYYYYTFAVSIGFIDYIWLRRKSNVLNIKQYVVQFSQHSPPSAYRQVSSQSAV